MPYDAFISYSHAADGNLAPAVQAGLERFAKSWWRRRALRIFRDETGLGVNPHLWRSIETALGDSSWFVLLASPDAAASVWVNKEIEHWLASKSAERILPVITDGTVRWDDAANDFATDATAIPPALRSRYDGEPLYLDLRWARSEDELDLRHPRFKTALCKARGTASRRHTRIARNQGRPEATTRRPRRHRGARRPCRGGDRHLGVGRQRRDDRAAKRHDCICRAAEGGPTGRHCQTGIRRGKAGSRTCQTEGQRAPCDSGSARHNEPPTERSKRTSRAGPGIAPDRLAPCVNTRPGGSAAAGRNTDRTTTTTPAVSIAGRDPCARPCGLVHWSWQALRGAGMDGRGTRRGECSDDWASSLW